MLSPLGIAIGAALLTALPISVQPSSQSVVQLSVDKADAQYGSYRRHYRRAYRPAPYYEYGYGYNSPIFPYYSYGLYPTAFGRAYRPTPLRQRFLRALAPRQMGGAAIAPVIVRHGLSR